MNYALNMYKHYPLFFSLLEPFQNYDTIIKDKTKKNKIKHETG